MGGNGVRRAGGQGRRSRCRCGAFFYEFHSAIFASCQDVEDHGVLVRRILMNHLECPVAARTEEQMVVWIETGSVHTLAMPETNSEGKRIKHVPSRVSSSTGDFPVQDEVWLARASTGRLNLESQRSASLADHYLSLIHIFSRLPGGAITLPPGGSTCADPPPEIIPRSA